MLKLSSFGLIINTFFSQFSVYFYFSKSQFSFTFVCFLMALFASYFKELNFLQVFLRNPLTNVMHLLVI